MNRLNHSKHAAANSELLHNAKKESEDSGIEINKLEPVEMSIDEITSKIQRLDKKMQELGDVNMRAITTYDEKLARQTEIKEQIEVLSKERKRNLSKDNARLRTVKKRNIYENV